MQIKKIWVINCLRVLIYIKSEESSRIPHYMAPCYGRYSVLEEGIRIEDYFVYTAINIYLYEDHIMIFEYHKAIEEYVPLDWVKKSKLSTECIEDCLFQQEQPQSTDFPKT